MGALISVCLSIMPHVLSAESLNGFRLNLLQNVYNAYYMVNPASASFSVGKAAEL
jgi:hypothetical protein